MASPEPSAPSDATAAPRPRRDRLVRRGLKLACLVVLVYYLLPPKVSGVPVYWAFALGAGLIVLIELARFTRALRLPALRSYEEARLAGYVYWAAALALLVAFFPEGVAVAALVAAAIADVVAGELRGAGHAPSRVRLLTLGLFAVPACALLVALLPGEPIAFLLAAGAAGSVVAALVEGRRWPGLDDDLLMPLAPALVWVGLSVVVPGAHAFGLHWPWAGPP